MAVVMTGVNPHEASHTAVRVSADEEPLGQLRVRAPAVQARRLPEWGAAWPERAGAVEGAMGPGHPLAQQLARLGSGCWTCTPGWPPGSGCWRRKQ